MDQNKLNKIIGKNIKKYRSKTILNGKKLTQEKLAELCNTETSYIGQIETKKRLPSLTFIEKIASAINIKPYLLFKPIDNLK